jgi:hypothetical protein
VSDKRPGADEPWNRLEATQPLWRDAASGVSITTCEAQGGRLGSKRLVVEIKPRQPCKV